MTSTTATPNSTIDPNNRKKNEKIKRNKPIAVINTKWRDIETEHTKKKLFRSNWWDRLQWIEFVSLFFIRCFLIVLLFLCTVWIYRFFSIVLRMVLLLISLFSECVFCNFVILFTLATPYRLLLAWLTFCTKSIHFDWNFIDWNQSQLYRRMFFFEQIFPIVVNPSILGVKSVCPNGWPHLIHLHTNYLLFFLSQTHSVRCLDLTWVFRISSNSSSPSIVYPLG